MFMLCYVQGALFALLLLMAVTLTAYNSNILTFVRMLSNGSSGLFYTVSAQYTFADVCCRTVGCENLSLVAERGWTSSFSYPRRPALSRVLLE